MTSFHFALFRIVLGAYLSIHFLHLIPYGEELFSINGIFIDPSVLPSYGWFPNLFFVFTSPSAVYYCLWIFVALSVFLTLGIARQSVALILWFVWASLLGRQPFIANPSIPFIGLLLLCCSVIASGESLRAQPGKKEEFSLPPYLWQGVIIIVALCYTISGIHKLGSPSWIDGSAMRDLVFNPLARPWGIPSLIRSLPEWTIQLLTWSGLALEILFAPLYAFSSLRRYVWLAMVGMHVGILSMVSFADLTVGMLIVHLFIFDVRWIRENVVLVRGNHQPIVFYDGECGMCNKFVQLVLRNDRQKVFQFAPLQGKTAQAFLPGHYADTLSTVVVLDENRKPRYRSEAALYICEVVGGYWYMFLMLRMLPVRFRDMCYRVIASNRKRLFARSGECVLLTADQKKQFLD